MPSSRSDQEKPSAIDLLRDLAEAAGRSHTRRAAALHIAEAVARHVPVNHVDLGWCEPDGRRARVVRASLGGDAPEVTEEVVRLDGYVRRALRTRAPVVARVSPAVVHRPPRAIAALPLLSPDGPETFAFLDLGHTPWSLLEKGFLGTVAAIIASAVRHCALVERIAALSRRAIEGEAILKQRLETYASAQQTIVGRSPALRAALERADLVAPYPTTVLLTGESGTGKELFARRIHARSPQAAGPFVQVNCGAIPEGLVESELFGHERGAFTGATAPHAGRFERAHGGTLLLDEVGDLPAAAQVKLLRALQERTIERVGGERAIAIDVRVIAATHRPLRALVEAGTFRADLLYRLDVFPLALPPLRERAEDLPGLVQHLLAATAARLGRDVPRVPAAALARLGAHRWPGNVRELANVLERALVMTRGDDLDLGDWSPEGGPRGSASSASGGGGGARTFAEASRAAIEEALAACRGRVYGRDGAAARLGLKPTTLQGKMRKHGIARAGFTMP